MKCFRNWISYVGRHIKADYATRDKIIKSFYEDFFFKRDAIIHISILQYVLFSSPGPLPYRICLQFVLRIQVHVVLDNC